MIRRLASFALILFGAATSILSILVDPLGIGAAPQMLGWKNMTGAFTGVFIAIIGLWLGQLQIGSDVKSKKDKDLSK